MRLLLVLSLILVVLAVFAAQTAAQGIVAAWLPIQPGDTWIYQNEERDGGNGGGMANPEIGRWRTEEKIVSSVSKPDGILLLTRSTALDSLPPVALRRPGIKEVDESYSLIHGNCVYAADKFRDDIPPDFCFPLARNSTFGGTTQTSPAEEFVWRVIGLDADPFGLKGQKTFHLKSHQGSGTMVDRWFVQGIGILQEIIEHHGTYNESRSQLLSTVIAGQRRMYELQPARTTPLSDLDCDGAGWRHFARIDGRAFLSRTACVQYVKAER